MDIIAPERDIMSVAAGWTEVTCPKAHYFYCNLEPQEINVTETIISQAPHTWPTGPDCAVNAARYFSLY